MSSYSLGTPPPYVQIRGENALKSVLFVLVVSAGGFEVNGFRTCDCFSRVTSFRTELDGIKMQTMKQSCLVVRPSIFASLFSRKTRGTA